MTRVPLLDVARLVRDRIGPFEGERDYLPTGGLSADGERRTERITGDARPARAVLAAEVGDVCVARMAAADKALLVDDRASDLVLSSGFAVLRPDPARVLPRFLWHWARTPDFRDRRDDLAVGATQRAITNTGIAELRVPLLPLAEQGRVVEALDRADRLVALRRRAERRVEDLQRSVHAEMFAAPRDDWPLRPLGEVTRSLNARRRPVRASERPGGPVPYYGATGQQGWIDQALFDEPLVLVTEDGGHFAQPGRGVAYRVDGPAWVNNHAHVLRPGPDLDVEYLHRTLRHHDFTPFVSGSTRGKLTLERLRTVPVVVPDPATQRVFAARSAAVGRLREQVGRRAERERALVGSLRSRAFGGGL